MKERLVQQLKEFIPNDKEVIYVCIGTPKVLADSFAPLFGSLIKQRDLDIEVYGDLYDSVNALNVDCINEMLPKDKYVVAIDSCISTKVTTPRGELMIEKGSIKPGSGVGKDLMSIGDVSIKGITVIFGEGMFRNDLTLTDVYDMANMLADIIEEFEIGRREVTYEN